MKSFRETVYSLIIGLAVALFAGFTVSAIAPGPSFDMADSCYQEVDRLYQGANEPTDAELDAAEEASQRCLDKEDAKHAQAAEKQTYQLFGAVTLIGAGYMYVSREQKLGPQIIDGLGFGLVFTALYSIITSTGGYIAEVNRILPVIASGLTLASAILVTQMSFTKPKTKTAKKTKK